MPQAIRQTVRRVKYFSCYRLSVLGLGLVSYAQELGKPTLGFHWTNANMVYVVRKDGPAERAGVQQGDLFVPRFLHLSAIGLPLAFSYTLLKGQWAALDSFVNWGLVYTGLVALLVTIYLALVEFCGRLLGIAISREGLLLTLASALIIAFLFVPLRAGLQSLVDRLFYRR